MRKKYTAVRPRDTRREPPSASIDKTPLPSAISLSRTPFDAFYANVFPIFSPADAMTSTPSVAEACVPAYPSFAPTPPSSTPFSKSVHRAVIERRRDDDNRSILVVVTLWLNYNERATAFRYRELSPLAVL